MKHYTRVDPRSSYGCRLTLLTCQRCFTTGRFSLVKRGSLFVCPKCMKNTAVDP